MANIWTKLNLKEQTQIVVVNAPQSFKDQVDQLEGVKVVRSCGKVRTMEFSLAFVTKLSEIARIAKQVAAKSVPDAVVWFAYPKQTSKKYQCEFNRDTGWEPMLAAGFKGVRQVAIDDDWSAIRFRREQFVKSTKR